MNEQIKRLVGKLIAYDENGQLWQGTAFRVGGKRALTVYHNVGDRELWLTARRVSLFPDLKFLPDGDPKRAVSAWVVDNAFDPTEDWALIDIDEPELVEPAPPCAELGTRRDDSGLARFTTFGFPALARNTGSGLKLSGTVLDAKALYQEAWAYQLQFDGVGGEAPPLGGLSGAPCVVDGAVVGIVRTNLVKQQDGKVQMVLGMGWACPLASPGLQGLADSVPLRLDPIPGLPGLPRRELPADPFRYPEWFGVADAEVFFGRNAKIREIYTAATEPEKPRVVLVYGASGVGKSSLLEAGVLPRLRMQHDVRTHRLAAGRPLRETLRALLAQPQAQAGAGLPRIVIVDQVEELFWGPGADGNAALRDASTWIADTLAGPDAPVRIVLGFRGEYLPQVVERLREARLAHSLCLVERMSAQETEDVVRGIASTRRLRSFYEVEVDEALPRMISDDVLKDPKSPATSLLSIILTKLWAHARTQTEEQRRLDARVYQLDMRARVSIRAFLEEQLALVAADCPELHDAGLADDVLYEHTTAEGYAGEMTREQRRASYPTLEATQSDLLASLIRHRLLYRVPKAEDEPTRIWHDTLAIEVRSRYQLSMKWGQRARRLLEARAREPVGADGAPAALDTHDLGVVRRGLRGMRAPNQTEQSIVNASERQAVWVQLRQWLVGALGAIALVALGLAGLAWHNDNQAQAQRLVAGAAAAMSEREFRSAQLLLARAVNLDDQTAYREMLLEARLRSPSRVSTTPLPAGCARLLALRSDGGMAACLQEARPGGAAGLGLMLYQLDASGTVPKKLPTSLSAANPGEARAEFGPDGALVVFGSTGMQFFADPLRPEGAEVRQPLPGAARRVAVCGRAPHRVAFAIKGQPVLVWTEGGAAPQPVGASREVSALALDADCAHLAVALEGIEVESWEQTGGAWRRATTFTSHRDVVRSLAYGHDGLVASAGTDATLRFWDAVSGTEHGRVAGRADFSFVVLSGDGQRVLSRSYDQRVQVWERSSGRLLATLREFDDQRGQVVTRDDLGSREAGFVGQDASTIFFRNSAGEVEVWRLDNEGEGFVLHEAGTVGALAFHPTLPLLASAGDDAPESKLSQRQRPSRVRYWDLNARRPLPPFAAASAPVVSLWFAAQGRRLVATDASNQVTVWDESTRAKVAPEAPLPPSGWALGLADPPPETGDWLVTADPELLALKVVDLASGKTLHALDASVLDDSQGDGSSLSAVMLLRGRGLPAGAPDRRNDLLVAANKRVSFYDLGQGQPRLLLRKDVGRGVYGIAFDPLTQRVAIGSSSRQVQLFDVGRPEQGIRALDPLPWHHDGGISSLVYCGGWLMSAGNDGVVRVTEAAHPEHSIALRVHDSPAWWVSCNAAQNLAASGSTDGTIRVFDLQRMRAMLSRPAPTLLGEAEAASGLKQLGDRIVRSR